MERRLIAILIADIVGYSETMSQDEAGTLTNLQILRKDLIEPTVAEFKGRVVKAMGDGFLVEFASAVDATNCAMKWQSRAAARDNNTGLRFRIGVNLGDILIDGEDIFGDGVNVAARLEALADPGGICISAAVHDQVRKKINANFQDTGLHKMKNLPEALRVYRIVPDSDPKISGGSAPPLPAKPSIAVLPFDNMSTDPEQEHFCDGISEDLITELARNPSLFVIARHSSFVYKGKLDDIRRIGRDLGVLYLVEGSVRRASDRIRITAQLINAQDGGHLWAERYDRDISDIFAVQDDVVRQIVSALGEQLQPPQRTSGPRGTPERLEAYEWLLKGRQHVFRAQGRTEAREALHKAIELDPTLADAHAWLAVFLYSDWVFYHKHASEETMSQAVASARAAIRLAPESALAHMSLGIVNLYGGQRDTALGSLRRALELNPNDADVLVFLQEAYTFEGQPLKGIESVRRAMRLNPHYPEWYLWHLGFALFAAGRYREAVTTLRQLTDIKEPTRILAAALAKLGQLTEAQEVAAAFRKAFPDFSIQAWARTQPFKRPADLENFTQGYRLAGLPD